MPWSQNNKLLRQTLINAKMKSKLLIVNLLKSITRRPDYTKPYMKTFSAEFKSIKLSNTSPCKVIFPGLRKKI